VTSMDPDCQNCISKTSTDRMFSSRGSGVSSELVHAELTFDGQLDEERLRSALLNVDEAHPLLRSRQCSDVAAHWRPHVGLRSRLSSIEVADELELDLVRSRSLTDSVDLDVRGPLSLKLARNSAGDHLIGVAHHALVDGVSMFRIFSDIGLAYGGGQLVPDTGWQAARLDGAADFDPSQIRPMAGRVRERTRRTPVRIVGDGSPFAPAAGVVVTPLDTSQIADLAVPARVDRLVRAVGAAIRLWNGARGAPTEPIVIGLAVNLRPHDHWTESVCNASFVWPIALADDGTADCDDVAAAQAAEVRLGRRSRAVRAVLAVIGQRDRPPVWAMRAMTGSTVVSAVAHIGTLINFGEGAPDIVAAWGTPPAVPSSGIAFGACLDDDSAWVSARYLGQRFRSESARALLKMVSAAFEG
jgi:NRPS condensation-like uncharacterized protein